MQDVHRSALLSLLLAAASEMSGTRPDAVAQTQPTPTFPSGVDVITVDAVVVDRKGLPVPGLAREDFVVTEDGRPQEIVTFEAVEAAPMAMPAEPDEPATVATSVPSSGPGREFVVLLDDIWIPRLDTPSVREALTAFLTRSMRSGDQVTVASTSGDLQWTGRIPEGREDLLAVVARFNGRAPAIQEVFVDASGVLREMSDYQAYGLAQGPGSGTGAIAREVDALRRQRTALTLAALRRQLEALSSAGGRKSVLLFTQGLIQDTGPELGEALRMAHEANVAIYFLGVRGLLTTPGYSAAIGGAPDPSGVAASIIAQDVFASEGSQDLAADTGGFSVRGTNDLSKGLDRIAAESRVFYLLGIHPPPGKSPGEWRRLRVAVKTSGLTVRARRGYAMRPASDRVRPRPGASIPMRLASYVLEPVDAEKTRVAVAIEIDGSTLPSAREQGAPPILRVSAIPRDGSTIRTADLPLHRDELAEGRWEPAHLDLALPRDVYRVRAEVEDPTSGRRGVVEQRVVVPDQALFRTSTPVLSDTLLPASIPGAPLPAPVAHRRFGVSDGRPLLYAFAVLGAAKGPAAERPDVRFRLMVKDPSDRVLVETSDATVTPSANGRLEQVVGLPLAQMPAGQYELHLAVRDHVAGTAVERKETFVVEAAPAHEPVAPPAPTAPVASDLAPILERAGEYVIAYQALFSDLIAEEDYQQRFSSGAGQAKRRSRADMLFVTLPGPIPWAGFRDVYEVDGQKVRDREGRLERLFRDSPDGAAAAASRAQAILDESARFNLGPVRRTINIPTFALLVVHPDNQHRFAFERTGRETIDGTRTVEIAFTERLRPTIVSQSDGGDVAAQGRIWIDAEQGTVLRTEIAYGSAEKRTRRAHTRIVTEYGREPRLQMRVPVRMTETYELRGGAIKTVARYSGYRRFEVTTDEKYVSPPE